MKRIKIPVFLHDVFGERQSVLMLLVILLFGLLLCSALFYMYPMMYLEVGPWRSVLAFILVFDIFSGCLANFTKSTNHYYAKNKIKRIIFISIHVHLILIAVLLDFFTLPVVLVWMYTIICAFIINALKGETQIIVAGLLLSLGIGLVPMLEMESYMLIISLLFMLKVLYSFSVNHYQTFRDKGENIYE